VNDNQSLAAACTDTGFPVSTYDDGFGPLFVYENDSSFRLLVRAQNEYDALEIVYDEMKPVSAQDVHEAYGFFISADFSLTQDVYEAPYHIEHGTFASFDAAQKHALGIVRVNELDLCEGYRYQSNATDTGIVFHGYSESLRAWSADSGVIPILETDDGDV
jgi:hypothetical protein